ncbi:hypothetical protein SORBI_3004G007032 [Sorghum bicolor]|uniref:Uncharacterized protein n=3 Tax=Sorghum bicolor TaxID=4558 RepID=A0A1Z5RKI9_SORBI|nr:hypothetical protein SORBI_3004G007032 [Sorghum bicolor]
MALSRTELSRTELEDGALEDGVARTELGDGALGLAADGDQRAAAGLAADGALAEARRGSTALGARSRGELSDAEARIDCARTLWSGSTARGQDRKGGGDRGGDDAKKKESHLLRAPADPHLAPTLPPLPTPPPPPPPPPAHPFLFLFLSLSMSPRAGQRSASLNAQRLNVRRAGGAVALPGCSAAPPIPGQDAGRVGTAAGCQRGRPLELLPSSPPCTPRLLMCYSKP